MLSIGPGSVCDVCLEPFGRDLKVPCCIECGHVFCLDCLNHISRPSCPLCRTSFRPRSHIKLHIDVDAARPPVIVGEPLSGSAADAEARRLQDSIATVANEGSTESHLRQLITNCRTFLANYPRERYQELRVSHRMVAYLFEVKSRLRAQDQVVDDLREQMSTLTESNLVLTEKLAKLERERLKEREASLAVEMSLRHHCEQTQESYTQLVKLYSEAVARLDKIQYPPPGVAYVPQEWEQHRAEPPISARNSEPVIMSDADRAGLKAHNLLISPLPDFTCNTLPVSQESYEALPEVDSNVPQDRKFYSKTRAHGGCGAAGCPHSCNCAPISLFGEEARAVEQRKRGGHPMESATFTPDLHEEGPTGPTRVSVPQSPPSLLSITAPRTTDLHAGRTTRAPSFLGPEMHSNSRPPASPPSPHASQGLSAVTDVGGVNSQLLTHELQSRRLRELLDTPMPNLSSSLPNPVVRSYQQPSQVRNGRSSPRLPERSRSSSRSRPPSRLSRPPPPSGPTTEQAAEYIIPAVHITSGDSVSASSSLPSVLVSNREQLPTFSHASTAAQALERVHRQEKEDRRRASKDQEREDRSRGYPAELERTSSKSAAQQSLLNASVEHNSRVRQPQPPVPPASTRPQPIPSKGDMERNARAYPPATSVPKDRDWEQVATTSAGSYAANSNKTLRRDAGNSVSSLTSSHSSSSASSSSSSHSASSHASSHTSTHSIPKQQPTSSSSTHALLRPATTSSSSRDRESSQRYPQSSNVGSSKGKIVTSVPPSMNTTSLAA